MARDKSAQGTPATRPSGRTAGSRRIGSGSSGTATASPGSRSGRAPAAAGKAGKAGKVKGAQGRAERRTARKARFTQLRQAFTMTRAADPRLVPLLAVAFLVPFVLLLLIGFAVGHPLLLGLLGLAVGLVVATAVFGRRVQRHAFTQVEGQIGAAAAVLQSMRGDWRVTPAVGFTREQDLVHRVVGRPGIVLVGEGAAGRTRSLLVTEKKRLARFVGDVPVYDLLVGDGDGQVPLRGLEKHFARLPQNVKPKDVNILDRKLKAMPAGLPVPKGPMPGGAGGRVPRGKVR